MKEGIFKAFRRWRKGKACRTCGRKLLRMGKDHKCIKFIGEVLPGGKVEVLYNADHAVDGDCPILPGVPGPESAPK